MTEPVRVRFAPSPTGEPHVGNMRTALFNWLLARHTSGIFILRIEDTDVNRRVSGATEAIMEGLRWLGLDWDEGPQVGGPYGPYYQSERLPIYHQVAQRLLQEDHAYLCFCSPERLEQMRAEQVRQKQPPRYDRRCRHLTAQGRAEAEASGIKPVVRFKTPEEGQTTFHDLIRGEITFDNATLDDFVLLKSDGYPTYHLANVVDDHLMQITHIMRADEWLPSTPRHCLLYDALGYEKPQFAHLPMLLGSDRAKLSKRHGATSILAHRDQGYLPEAMLNFLALLGWSLDDHTEILSREELIRHFSLERVNKTGAIFSLEKLNWMNGIYMRRLSPEALAQRLIPWLDRHLPPSVARPLPFDYVLSMVPLVQERLKRLDEAPSLMDFFFLETLDYQPRLLLGKNVDAPTAVKALRRSLEILQGTVAFTVPTLDKAFRQLAQELALKPGDLFSTLRVAITGRTASPPLFETMAVLGRERCVTRVEAALAQLLPAP